jgi:(4-(4-[2-(gamma-L-glutamylamino)ethyl]phenoxymethyl)furan-2-yl)methanamine synthase
LPETRVTITAGLDVGGAHLKVALVQDGRTIAAEQFRCRLWMGMEKLDTALKKAAPLLSRASRHAITMTGELSDRFPDRKTGVITLVARMVREFGPDAQFWMGSRGFGSAADAMKHTSDVGSTNFLATAELVARRYANALLIDFGSTTADIIPIIGSKPTPRGLTDAERQVTGELVYTGYTRTAIMGVTNRAPFKGQWVSLTREYLATMADVRRILNMLPDGVDLHATADDRGKSVPESVGRFARMLGCDASDGSLDDWHVTAAFVREEQLRSIADGASLVLSHNPLPKDAPVIAAGIGASDVNEIARRLRRTCFSFDQLANASEDCRQTATQSAPAVAVALLLDTN